VKQRWTLFERFGGIAVELRQDEESSQRRTGAADSCLRMVQRRYENGSAEGEPRHLSSVRSAVLRKVPAAFRAAPPRLICACG